MTERSLAVATLLVIAMVLATPGRADDAVAPVVEPAAQPPFLGGFLTATRIVYPTRIGAWSALGEQRYDDQTAGVSVRFQHDSGDTRGWMDVFFYPAGMLDDAAFATFARGERAMIVGEHGRSPFDAIDAGPLALDGPVVDAAAAASTSPTPRPAPAWRPNWVFDLAGTLDGRRMASVMVLALDRMYFIKVRHTVDLSHADRLAARAAAEAFMQDLRIRTRIASTGDCWRVPPIVERPGPLDPAAEGAIASSAANGRVTGVGFRDRIDVLEAGSASAAMLQSAVVSRLGRRAAGCVAPDPVEAAVEAGMREIRIDYRLPSASPASGSRRTRAPRSGVG